IIKYEDLVGAQGGGEGDTQLKTLKSFLNFLEIEYNPELIDNLSNDLYGGTRTFSKGSVDSWKEELTPDQVSRLESSLSEFMTRFGYL
ncbi:MAG: hypothetical protein ACFFFK_01150, partial [Candidatus Thorarchaeota archaeon]